MFHLKNSLLLALFALGVAFYLSGCQAGGEFTGREYMPDMAHSQAYEIYTPTRTLVVDEGDTIAWFNSKTSARKPVAGTIPRGYMPYHFDNTNEGYEAAGATLFNPLNKYQGDTVEYDRILTNAKTNFETHCAICHGNKGKGDGEIVKNGAYPAAPPSYFSATLMELPEGKMFHSIHHGKNLMGAYGPQLTKTERWEIVSYIKDMQADKISKDDKMSKEQALGLITNGMRYKQGGAAAAAPAPAAVVDNAAANTTDTVANNNLTAAADEAAKADAAASKSALDDLATQPLKAGQSIVLKNVYFETGSFRLKQESYKELNKLVSILKNNPKSKVEISGHTDNTGNASANLNLSQNRAKSVYNYVISQGIPKAALQFKGYGQTKPVASNNTDEGRAQNRRTEFRVLE